MSEFLAKLGAKWYNKYTGPGGQLKRDLRRKPNGEIVAKVTDPDEFEGEPDYTANGGTGWISFDAPDGDVYADVFDLNVDPETMEVELNRSEEVQRAKDQSKLAALSGEAELGLEEFTETVKAYLGIMAVLLVLTMVIAGGSLYFVYEVANYTGAI